MLGAAIAVAAERALLVRRPGAPARWTRTNHRGTPVSLAAGPALALGVSSAASVPFPAALIAGLGAGMVGAYDDAVGGRHQAKGFRGHLAAVRQGTLTGGAVKVLGIGATGLVAGRALDQRRGADLLVTGALVAVTANLLNLLDVRPGRALKAGVACAVALDQPGVAAACIALLPGDLAERTMLGDTGANALGAVLGACLSVRLPGRRDRLAALLGISGLMALSEVVSYSVVIDRTGPLRWLDQLGRRR